MKRISTMLAAGLLVVASISANAAIVTFNFTGETANSASSVTGTFSYDTDSINYWGTSQPNLGDYRGAGSYTGNLTMSLTVTGGTALVSDGFTLANYGTNVSVVNDYPLNNVPRDEFSVYNDVARLSLFDWTAGFIDSNSLPTSLPGIDYFTCIICEPGTNKYSTFYIKDLSATQSQVYTLTSLTSVPVPASAWLFGSGLFGLISIARRKHHD